MKTFYSAALLWAVHVTAIYAQHSHENHPIGASLNPEIGVVINGNFYTENSEEGISHIQEEMSGFGHGHSHDDHAHGPENGFNLSEVEIYISGEIDGFLRAESTLAFTTEEAELETAFVETTSLPWGFALKGGKFFSDFGILNSQHPHQWGFADQPLIYTLTLGGHGLNDVGVQAVWSLESQLLFTGGVEVFQGSNERIFAHEGEDPLPNHEGPRLGIGWLKLGPDLGHHHTLQFGVSGGHGRHQEIHEETSGFTHYLDGFSTFAGADLLYQYGAHGEHGQGNITIQAEYLYRNKDLDLEASDETGAPLGENLESRQDGYYIQALYGFWPRWSGGLRWEQVGLINQSKEPGEATEKFGDSWKATAKLDFSPSDRTLIRLQASNGEYETEDGLENIWETYLQLVITLGAHRHQGGAACSGH